MAYRNSVEIMDRRAVLRGRAEEIIAACRREVRELTDGERAEFEAIKAEASELAEEERSLKERIAAIENPVAEENDNKTQNTNTIKMEKKFSLVRAIRNIANGQPLDDVSRAVVMAGAEEARKAGVSTQGQIQIPLETRSAVTVNAEGEDIVATELWDLLTPLRAKNVLSQAGARFYGGLVGNVQIPTMSATNVGWAGEISDASDGAPSFSHVTLSPKRLTAYIDISKMLLAQDSIDVENAIRNDLVSAINSKLEATILGDADGDATKPEGMLHALTPATVSTFADIVDLEADIEDANVFGECVYVMSNKAKAALRNMSKSTNHTALVYENGEVDGTKALNTSNVSGTDYIYGDWSNLAIGNWGGIDLTVDPYTLAKSGQVRIVVNAFFDAAILREEAFAAGAISVE